MAKRSKKRSARTRNLRTRQRESTVTIESEVLNSAKILILSAGIITIVTGLIFAYISYLQMQFSSDTIYSLISVGLGILMLLMLLPLKHKPRATAVWMIVFSILALMPFAAPWGFFIGPIFGWIAGILVLLKINVY